MTPCPRYPRMHNHLHDSCPKYQTGTAGHRQRRTPELAAWGGAVGRLAKATFITFFVYLCSTNVELVTKPNLDNNKQIYLNHQLLLTCVVLSLEYYVSYRTTYTTLLKSSIKMQSM
jgi:hypothetical protein